VTSPRRGLLLPSLSAAIGVLILLGLGSWQLYRLQWKQAVLAQIAAAEHSPPMPLTEHPPTFGRVSVTGRFRFDHTMRLGVEVRETPRGSIIGYHQIVPLERDGAPTLLVNRGWVPDAPNAPVKDPEGPVTVTGFIRQADPGSWFTPANDIARRQIYALNPPAIAQQMGFGPVEPFSLTVLGTAPDGQFPQPATDFPRPANNHLSYAITWYTLAGVLVVIFALRLRANTPKA